MTEKVTSPIEPEMKAKAAEVVKHLAAALKAAEGWRLAGNSSMYESELAIEDLIDTWHLAARGVV